MVTNTTGRIFVTYIVFILYIERDLSPVWLPIVARDFSEWMIVRPHKYDGKWSQTNVMVFQEFPD